MRSASSGFWIVLPVLASLATDCRNTPRGAVPTGVAQVEITLASSPAAPHADRQAVEDCLQRLGPIGNHVRPSWRDDTSTTAYDPGRVALVETSPNVFAASFRDVPARVQLTLTVHDVNECRRRPVIPGMPGVQGRLADGRVTAGVSANGTPLTRVAGNDALVLVVASDGTVTN